MRTSKTIYSKENKYLNISQSI